MFKKLLIKYLKKEKWYFIAALSMTVIATALAMAPPQFVKFITNVIEFYVAEEHSQQNKPLSQNIQQTDHQTNAISPQTEPRTARSKSKIVQNAIEVIKRKGVIAIVPMLLIGLGIYVVLQIFTLLKNFFIDYFGKRIVARLREDMFNQLVRLPYLYYKKSQTGDLISKVINDVRQIEDLMIGGFTGIFADTLMFIGAVVAMFYINPRLSMYFFIIGPVFAFVITKLGNLIKEVGRKIQEGLADITTFIHKTIYGIEIVKVFAAEQNEIKRFKKVNRDFLNHQKKAVFFGSLNKPMVELMGAVGLLTALGLSAVEMMAGRMTFGDINAFILYITTLLSPPVRNLSHTMLLFQRSRGAIERIEQLMALPPEKSGNYKPEKVEGTVEFENVWFAYDEDKYVLKGVNLKVPKGKTVAIVGMSGAGKSTMVALIPALITPQKGTVKIDGIPVTEYDYKELRKHIAMVSQEVILFDGTVKDNISYGIEDVPFEKIVEAAKIANAHDFITKLPNGYNTYIGERGTRLSGGERQRIALARAVLRKPSILILDEATSALDAESEKAVQVALSKIMHLQTTFVIAHRLSTVVSSDIITVLDDGIIKEIGTHEELMKKGGIYKRLYEIQFGTKES